MSDCACYCEYRALASAVKEAHYAFKILQSIGIEMRTPIVYCDNSAAISVGLTLKENGRTRHINVKFHLVRQAIADKSVILRKIDSINNIAYILTKALNNQQFYTHAFKLLQILEEIYSNDGSM